VGMREQVERVAADVAGCSGAISVQ
jgi:hypothetical protein